MQHSSPLVRYVTLCTLGRLLRALEPLMEDMDCALRLSSQAAEAQGTSQGRSVTPGTPGGLASSRQTAADWAAFAAKLRASVRARLPDPQALVALYGQLEAQPAAPAAAPAAAADAEVLPEAAAADAALAEVFPLTSGLPGFQGLGSGLVLKP